MMFLLTLASSLAALTSLTSAFSGGPPVSSVGSLCGSMTPMHGVTSQTSPPPYEIIAGNCYRPNQEIAVTVRATGNYLIKGILIQARKESGTGRHIAVGQFRVTDPVLSALTCNTNPMSAAGHNQAGAAMERVFYWTPPSDITEDIQFKATIVAMKTHFWTYVSSASLRLDPHCGE